MAIRDKDRKVLWGRAGNHCAICRQPLVADATSTDPEAVVGDEAHIVAQSADGPRGGQQVRGGEIDGYANLILLCRVDHKRIDDQPNHYTMSKLHEIKSRHEQWVRTALGMRVKTKPKLQPRYDETSAQYRHPSPDASWVIYHRVGLFNAPDAEPLRHVQVHLVGMSPHPRHLNGFEPVIPYAVPMLSDGDTSIGITLPPGREELWVVGYTSTGSDGSLNAAGFAPPDQRWRGLPWQLDADQRCRLSYEVVCDDHEPVQFSIVLFADGGNLHCGLEG